MKPSPPYLGLLLAATGNLNAYLLQGCKLSSSDRYRDASEDSCSEPRLAELEIRWSWPATWNHQDNLRGLWRNWSQDEGTIWWNHHTCRITLFSTKHGMSSLKGNLIICTPINQNQKGGFLLPPEATFGSCKFLQLIKHFPTISMDRQCYGVLSDIWWRPDGKQGSR